MNVPRRGELQNQQIVIRVAQTDKDNVMAAAQKKGISMSTLIRGLLIDNEIISAVN